RLAEGLRGARREELREDRRRPPAGRAREGRLAARPQARPAGDEPPGRLRRRRRTLGQRQARGLGGRRGLGVRAADPPGASRALRATPAGRTRWSPSGWSTPRPFGSARCPAAIAASTATVTTTLARLVVRPACRFPASPAIPASSPATTCEAFSRCRI